MAPTINLLPPELLSEVLQRVVQGAKSHRGQHVRFLSHVNQHWRSVALGTPQLWTTIVTKAPFDAVYDFERIMVWSARAKTLPITFVLRDIKKGADKALVDIFKIIGPTVETILFEPGHYWPLDRMLAAMAPTTLSFARLQNLRSNGALSLVVVSKHFPGAMPSIKQLSLALLDLRGREMVKDVWPWLTTLHAPYVDVGRDVLLANAPCLQYCSFTINTDTMQVQRYHRHDALRSFFFNGHGQQTEDFGDYLPSFPHLQHLGIKIYATHGTEERPSPYRLFQSCGSTLRYLELSTSTMDVTQLTRCLILAPFVRFLHLYGGVTEEFIRALTFHPESNPILPELTMLSLSEILFTQIPLWELAMSRARIPGVNPQNPRLSSSSSIMPDIASVHIGNPPLRRALRYITMSEMGRIHEHRSRFGFTSVRMRDELGISLKIIGGAHHMPRRDAMEMLKLPLNEAAKWDWKERDYVWKPT